MNVLVESSLVIRWLRRLVSSSRACVFLVALARPMLRAARHVEDLIAQGTTLHNDAAALARVTVVVEDSRLLTVVKGWFAIPCATWRYSVADKLVESVLRHVRALELWQRVRLIGWMLFVAVLTYRLLVGLSDPSIRSMDLITWGGMLVLSLGLMWGCRAVASAWVHRAEARSRVR